MPLNHCFAELLADPRNTVRRPPPDIPIGKVRKAANTAMLLGPAGPAMETIDVAADAGGRSIPARLYRPLAGADLPLVVFSHGGGWVWGDLETHDALCRQLAAQGRFAVLAVDYRLSPEHLFPAAALDVLDVLCWAASNARDLSIDRSRLSLCGDSAGGNLALTAASMAPSRGVALRHLSLIYPALDPTCSSASQQSLAEGYMLTRDAMRWFWSCYLGNDTGRGGTRFPAISDLASLPPVSIGVAEFDILRDEGIALAKDLKRAGNAVRLTTFSGMLHGFLSLPIPPDLVNQSIRTIAADIGAHF